MNSDLLRAIEILNLSGVVAIPTETVYGLAARIDRPAGIKKIFSTKQRPFFDPLIVHVASVQQARTLSKVWPRSAEALAQKFWPGPLTLVVPKNHLVDESITSGLDSVGLRMPNHPMALELITATGPLAAPSANKFGKTSPTSSAHVKSEFYKEDVFILEGGDCSIGIESTVLSVKPGFDKDQLCILRHGQISETTIHEFLMKLNIPHEFVTTISKQESPGHMKHHYMPAIPLIVIQEKKDKVTSPYEYLKIIESKLHDLPDFVEEVKMIKPQTAIKTFTLLQLGEEPEFAARDLYSLLRSAADSNSDVILFFENSIHQSEAWRGIMDRIHKAASLRLDETSTIAVKII